MTARLREMEETAEWHDGRWPSPEEAPMGGRLSLESRFPSFEEAIAQVKTATRRYAKRQRTWFRKDARIHWLSADDGDTASLAREVLSQLNGAAADRR